MKKLSANYHNLANVFMPIEDIEGHLVDILGQINDSVFGVDMHLTDEGANTFVIAPSHIETGEELVLRHREAPTEDFTFFEGYLSEAFFLPLRQDKNGLLINDLCDLALQDGEEVHVQWLLRRRYGWQERAIDMYDSYIQGNEKPSWSKWSRKLQDKAVRVLNKIQPEEFKPYEPLAEEKIQSECFQFQFRIAIKSSRVKDIVQYIQYALGAYTALNSVKLSRSVDKQAVTSYTDCVLAAYTKDQLLSLNEVFSLLGGTLEKMEEVLEEVVAPSRAIELLPMHVREEVELDDSIEKKVAEALKKVKLIDTARLYNTQLTAGLRLNILQADIPSGRKITDVKKQEENIQAAMGVNSLAIEQGVGSNVMKFSIPSEKSVAVSLRELAQNEEFVQFAKEHPLAFIVGLDEMGKLLYLSLPKLVHLLIAGTTGSGKSVFLNVLIVSLMLNYTPAELQFLMIDPKLVELQHYKDSAHVIDVITKPEEAALKLAGLAVEMDHRYMLLQEAGVKDISVYNQTQKEKMPYIVCVIDEYADLKDMNKDVEVYVARLGQKARAAGIHLVLATQRPSADIVTGRIKAVIPNAISFRLQSPSDYVTVFGKSPKLNLMGEGDGVMRIQGAGKEFIRFQSPIVSVDPLKELDVYEKLNKFYQGERVTYKMLDAVEESSLEPVQDVLSEDKVNTLEEEKEAPKQGLEALEAMFTSTEDDPLYKLKKIIANTGETRSDKLRSELGVKRDKMRPLMTRLVEDGWLVKGAKPSDGYKLIATADMLADWKD